MTNRKVNRRSLVQGAASAALFGAPFVFAPSPANAEAGTKTPSDGEEDRRGGENADEKPRQQESYGPPVWPPYDKLEALLKLWAGEHSEIMELEQLGRSVEGRPVYAVSLTDGQADADQKEHALVTSLHGGLERSASTTVMAIIEWLLSGDPTAREILRRQVVVCLPVPDPDRYEKGEVSPLYGSWNVDGPIQAAKIPEGTFVQRVIDRLQPELHADIHGTNLEFERYIMFESSATSYSNTALRPYHRDIIRQMDEAALAEGFPSDTAESDAERIFYGRGLANIQDRCWIGQPRFYGAMYAYYHFHSLIAASEVAWERSGLLRHRRLLEIGNERWPGEYYHGYPTRVIMGNTHARITAYGHTAAQRRNSRVELWNRFGEFTFGALDPAVEGKAMCVLATSAGAEKDFLTDPAIEVVVERLKEHPRMNSEAIARFAAGWPAGQNHPRAWLALQRRKADKQDPKDTAEKNGLARPIEHGISLRLRLAYDKAVISDLRLNGRPVATSETDGFVTWIARGCTFIQVNIPPKRLGEDDLFVVTCDYDPGEKRGRWDTWKRVGDVVR
jgi:zinc carboxypeptidase